MLGPITTWMGYHLWADKPSPYITMHLVLLSLPSLPGGLIEYELFWLGLGGARSPRLCRVARNIV